MKGPKKPTIVHGYMITFYKCPYCKNVYLKNEIKKHIAYCFRKHREKVRQTYSKRAKKNYLEGKILKFIPRRNTTNNDQKDTKMDN